MIKITTNLPIVTPFIETKLLRDCKIGQIVQLTGSSVENLKFSKEGFEQCVRGYAKGIVIGIPSDKIGINVLKFGKVIGDDVMLTFPNNTVVIPLVQTNLELTANFKY